MCGILLWLTMVMLCFLGGMVVDTAGRTIASIRLMKKASLFLTQQHSSRLGYITHANNRPKTGSVYPTRNVV